MAAFASSCFESKKIYDVFISFRGTDTRYNFTSHLHDALGRRKIKTYIEEEDLSRGEKISQGLVRAIESSQLSIIVFSENYASSSWCLDELSDILRCKDELQQIVIPVFYHVDPSHVRKQLGSYKEGFDQLEKRFKCNPKKLHNWRIALTEAANLSGFSTYDPKFRSESKLVDAIVEDVIKKLNGTSSFFVGSETLVGVELPIKQIESLLQCDSSGIRVLGIWGKGGIGKTTLARYIFWKLYSKFDAHCFLENVREKCGGSNEKYHLQSMLYGHLLGEEYTNAVTQFIRPTFSRDRLGRTRSLIILDDVSDKEQLENLVVCSFGSGTRIIVTSRDVECFETHVVSDCYEVKGLNSNEARRLFSLNVSNRNSPYPPELLEKVVAYAEGIPLVLNVLRSLFDHNRRENWEILLYDLKISRAGENIRNSLMISYNDLNKKQKNAFLDIACFFKGWKKRVVERILEDRGFSAHSSVVNDLVNKSLVSINHKQEICMHDLVQEMGFEVVHKQSLDPEDRSRLCDAQEIYDVLKNNRASKRIEGIFLDVSKIKDVHLSPDVFQRMPNLRLLKIYSSGYITKRKVQLPDGLQLFPDSLRYLYWSDYPLKYLPSKFAPEKLVELSITNSQVERLWDGVQNFCCLRRIDLSYSKNLTEIPDLSGAPNLVKINLSSCSSLLHVPSHNFRNLGKLRDLELWNCEKLKTLPEIIQSVENLYLHGSTNLSTIPEIEKENVLRLDLSESGIQELPESIGSFSNMTDLCLENCKGLMKLPSSIYQLKLKWLNLSGCSSLKRIPDLLPRTLVELTIDGTEIEEIPSSSFEYLSDLNDLSLRDCKRLQSLPTSICKLKSLYFLNLSSCSDFKHFPEILEPMESLVTLNLSKTPIARLPLSMKNLVGLSTLDLTACEKLEFSKPHIEACKMLAIANDWLGNVQSLRELRMCLLNFDAVPASISKLLNLDSLYVRKWKSVRSFPELPVDLNILDAEGCSSLICVSSSRCAIMKSFKEWNPNDTRICFFNCLKLDQNARDNIIVDGQLRIMRTAIYARSQRFESNYDYSACICYPGKEIPKWFVHEATGSSIMIKLPSNWRNGQFLGFSLCTLTAFGDSNLNAGELQFGIEFSLKTESGEVCKSNYSLHWVPRCKSVEGIVTRTDHVFMWYEFNSATAVYKQAGGAITEVSFHFRPKHGYSLLALESCEVKRCGIRLLYLEDAEDLFDDCVSDFLKIEEGKEEDNCLGSERRTEGNAKLNSGGGTSCNGVEVNNEKILAPAPPLECEFTINRQQQQHHQCSSPTTQIEKDPDDITKSTIFGCLLFLHHIRGIFNAKLNS